MSARPNSEDSEDLKAIAAQDSDKILWEIAFLVNAGLLEQAHAVLKEYVMTFPDAERIARAERDVAEETRKQNDW